MTVRILTDSTCDLPPEAASQLGIAVLPMYVHIGSRNYLDGIDLPREEFYQNLPGYAEHPSTAVPSPAKFHAIYDMLADEGATEVISIHISHTLSAVVDMARTAAAETRSAAVTVLDSRQLSLGTGFLAQKAAELAREGRTAREILPLLEDQIRRTYVAAGLETLKFLRRSGRMSAAVSTIGELMQIKPILKMDNGVSGVERVRTHQKVMTRLVEMIEAHSPFERIAFLHSGALQAAHALRGMVQHLLPDQEPWIGMINPVLGAHIGPGVVGFAGVTRKASGAQS